MIRVIAWVLRRLPCWVFGHHYIVVQEFSNYSRRVVCPECRGDWGMNDEVRAFIPWSGELQEMYESFGHIVHNTWPEK